MPGLFDTEKNSPAESEAKPEILIIGHYHADQGFIDSLAGIFDFINKNGYQFCFEQSPEGVNYIRGLNESELKENEEFFEGKMKNGVDKLSRSQEDKLIEIVRDIRKFLLRKAVCESADKNLSAIDSERYVDSIKEIKGDKKELSESTYYEIIKYFHKKREEYMVNEIKKIAENNNVFVLVGGAHVKPISDTLKIKLQSHEITALHVESKKEVLFEKEVDIVRAPEVENDGVETKTPKEFLAYLHEKKVSPSVGSLKS